MQFWNINDLADAHEVLDLEDATNKHNRDWRDAREKEKAAAAPRGGRRKR